MAKSTKTSTDRGSASADERIYIVPLRKTWLKVPRNKRVKKSVSVIRLFLQRHMHSDNIKLSQSLNEALWYRGIEKPPGKIKIKARRNKEGVVWARLPTELDIEDKGDKGRLEKIKEKVSGKKETPAEKLVAKMEQKKEEIKKQKEAKKEEKKPTEEKKDTSKKEKKSERPEQKDEKKR